MGVTGTFTPIPAANMEGLLANPADDIIHACRDRSVDVDKAWHGIHYLLTGTDLEGEPPLSWVILGNTPVDEGAGVTLLRPDEVQAVAAVLPMEEALRANYDPVEMEELLVSPPVWDEPDSVDWLIENYTPLAEMYREAAGRGDAVVIAIR